MTGLMRTDIALTPLQKSYALQRQHLDSSCIPPEREMYELHFPSFEETHFLEAVRVLCDAHPMLRAIVRPEANLQDVQDICDIPVIFHDFSGTYDESFEQLVCLKQHVFDSARVEHTALQAFHVVRFGDASATLLTLTDGIGMDGESQQIMLRDLSMLYRGMPVVAECDFAQYLEYLDKQMSSEEFQQARSFWLDVVSPEMNAYQLPRYSGDVRAENTAVCITRDIFFDYWRLFQERARENSLTPFSLLFTLYLRVLDRYSEDDSFLVLLPSSNRPFELEGIQDTVGMCADFLVFPWTASPEPESLAQTAQRVQDTLWSLYDHAVIPGPEVLKLLQERRGEQISPSWSFTQLDLSPRLCHEMTPFTLESIRMETGSLDAEVLVHQVDSCMRLHMTYRPGNVDAHVLGHMVDTYVQIVKAVGSNADTLNAYDVELAIEDESIIAAANDTGNDDSFVSLASLLEESVHAHWDNQALIALKSINADGDEITLTYGQLWQRAQAAAQVLADARSTHDGLRVGILMEKGPEQLIAAVAAILAGVAYMPIETTLPLEDIRWCIHHADVQVIMCDAQLRDKAHQIGIEALDCQRWECFNFDSPFDADSHRLLSAPLSLEDPDDAVVVINTSGTTGHPKSVLIGQDGLVSCLLHSHVNFEMSDGTVWRALAVTNFCHDMALFDYLGMFALGASVVVPYFDRVKDPDYLACLMTRYNVTFWNSVPAIMEMMLISESKAVPAALARLKRVVLGGDWIRLSTARKVLDLSDDTVLYSVGGPTETTLWNIFHRVDEEDFARGFVAYGKPFANTRYHILDARRRPCAVGMRGTMFVEGVGVAHGYAGDSEETARRFTTIDGVRMYQSGDLGMYLPDGNIRFMGRNDTQVKIHGKRIELGGIERSINEVAQLDMACCVLHGETNGLVLFYVGDLEPAEVFKRLSDRLTSYMVPHRIVKLDQLPLTYNGKPDRKKLALWDITADVPTSQGSAASMEGETDVVEAEVLTLLADVLGVASVSLDDNYYFIGGDSIAAMQFISKLYRGMHVELRIYDILNNPQIRDWMPLIKEQMAVAHEGGGIDDILAICRNHFNDQSLTDDTGLIQMGGSIDDAQVIGSKLGLSRFQILARPWPDYWCAAQTQAAHGIACSCAE